MNTQPIIFESNGPLSLPPECVCCGRPARNVCVIKPSDPSKAQGELMLDVVGFMVAPVHLIRSIQILQTKNVSFPMCPECRRNYFLPSKSSMKMMALVILCFVDAFYNGFSQRYGSMFIDLLGVIVFMVLAIKKNVRHASQALPVKVYLHDGKYRYVVYGGPIYNRLKGLKKT